MPPSITLTSPPLHEILTYPLAIINGKTSPGTRFIYASTSSSEPFATFPVHNQSFIAVYHLRPGSNTIRFALSSSALSTDYVSHTLNLELPSPLPFIRLVYLLTKDSNGSFQSPDPSPDNTLTSGIERLKTAGLMIQAATAEMMHAQGFQRRTFRLAPDVHVHRLRDITTKQALAMDGMQLWCKIAQELEGLPHRAESIDVVVMSFSCMQNGAVKAHTALGGGRLALFGGASMFTWPIGVDQIVECMLDQRPFDAKKWFDDSAGRMTRMGRRACTATTIGALLHELGHCLSLPHPIGDAGKDGGGIMARGFDHFDSLFVRSAESKVFWDRGSACRLKYHQFLQFDGEKEMRRLRTLSIDASGDEQGPIFWKGSDGVVKCRSKVGIGHVGFYKNGDNASHVEFSEPEALEFCLPSLKDIRKICHMTASDTLVVSAIDVYGRITDKPYNEV